MSCSASNQNSNRMLHPTLHTIRLIAASILTVAMLAISDAIKASDPSGADQSALALHVERLDLAWQLQVIAPTLQRLERLGSYEPRVTVPEDALSRLQAREAMDVALLRRSQLDGIPIDGVALLDSGLHACLVLAVNETAPWHSFADLNYGAEQGDLHAVASNASAIAEFQRLRNALPLANSWKTSVAPLRIAIQKLRAREADLLLLEVVMAEDATHPPEALELLNDAGLRLMHMPTPLFTDQSNLLPGILIIRPGGWFQDPRHYPTLCDPLVMVFNREMADLAIHTLHTPSELSSEAGAYGMLEQLKVYWQTLLYALGIDSFESH